MEKMNTVQPLFPHLTERLAGLEELAENLWWSWNPGARMLFKTLDRQACTPLTLGILRGAFGWTLFGIVWGLAIAGITLKTIYKASQPILSTALYLVMGWLAVITVKPLLSSMPTAGLFLLIAGGLSYTVGVAFFATDSRIPYGHFIWHLFVITGTTYHYFLVFWYVA